MWLIVGETAALWRFAVRPSLGVVAPGWSLPPEKIPAPIPRPGTPPARSLLSFLSQSLAGHQPRSASVSCRVTPSSPQGSLQGGSSLPCSRQEWGITDEGKAVDVGLWTPVKPLGQAHSLGFKPGWWLGPQGQPCVMSSSMTWVRGSRVPWFVDDTRY